MIIESNQNLISNLIVLLNQIVHIYCLYTNMISLIF